MTILQKLTLIQKTKRKVIKIKKEITILFLSLISLFLENLGGSLPKSVGRKNEI